MLLFILHELCTLLETWHCYSHESAKIKWNEMKWNMVKKVAAEVAICDFFYFLH